MINRYAFTKGIINALLIERVMAILNYKGEMYGRLYDHHSVLLHRGTPCKCPINLSHTIHNNIYYRIDMH